MAYGTANVDTIQSSTAGTAPQFNDGNGTQIGTLCRAWVKFVGGSTPTINGSFNVSSVTYSGTGQWVVNMTTALADTNYCVQVSNQQNASSNYSANLAGGSGTTTAFNVLHLEANALANPSSGSPMYVSVFR